MFNKRVKSKLSKVLALGMVATSASMAAQQVTANADQVKNTNTAYTRTTTKIGTVTATALTVRSGAGTSYTAIDYLSNGEKVTVLQTESNGWHKIKTSSGLVGYVDPNYLKVTTTTTDNNNSGSTNTGVYVVQSYSTISKVGKVTATSLNVRTGPSTSYSKKTTVTKGKLVGILKQYSNGWYEVKLSNGTVGCVSGAYLTIKAGTESDVTGTTSNGITVVQSYSTISKVGTVTTNSLNVRTGPSTSYSKKTTVAYGSVVGILKQYSNGWYEVKLPNGVVGCVSGAYLTIKAGTASDITSGSTSSGTTNSAKINAVISLLKKQLGKPYVYGAAGPSSFDCSGLTYYCYKNAAGITLNRSSAAQASNGRYVAKSQLQPGDLVFFNSGTNRIRHVGMYVGGGQFIHAPSTGKTVRYHSLNTSYYIKGYMTARRIIG